MKTCHHVATFSFIFFRMFRLFLLFHRQTEQLSTLSWLVVLFYKDLLRFLVFYLAFKLQTCTKGKTWRPFKIVFCDVSLFWLWISVESTSDIGRLHVLVDFRSTLLSAAERKPSAVGLQLGKHSLPRQEILCTHTWHSARSARGPSGPPREWMAWPGQSPCGHRSQECDKTPPPSAESMKPLRWRYRLRKWMWHFHTSLCTQGAC